jgi:hypothetical protein
MPTAKKSPATKKTVARNAAPAKKAVTPPALAKVAQNPAIAQKVSKTGAPKSVEAKRTAPVVTPAKGKRTDYEAMERDYRTGSFTDQELATKYGKSRQAVTKMAGAKGWKKDLTKAVREATRASLIADEATKKVAEQVAKGVMATVDTVQAAAETNKQVILGHRRDIAQARTLLNSMLSELQQVSLNPTKLHDLLEVLTGGDEMTAHQVAEARDALTDLQRLPSRILSVQRVAQAMTRLQMLERKAFGLDEPEQPPPVDEVADLSDEELDARIQARLANLDAKRAG